MASVRVTFVMVMRAIFGATAQRLDLPEDEVTALESYPDLVLVETLSHGTRSIASDRYWALFHGRITREDLHAEDAGSVFEA